MSSWVMFDAFMDRNEKKEEDAVTSNTHDVDPDNQGCR